MEADWSVELSADDPAIVVPWTETQTAPDQSNLPRLQFIDLHRRPAAIDRIAEARFEPALRSALLALNDTGSHLRTAKCGLWQSGSREDVHAHICATIVAEIDPREMDAEAEDAMFAAGCYIDILPVDAQARGSFATMENWLRGLTKQLRGVTMRCARADFVLRRSAVRGVPGFAVTWFTEACGASAQLAGLRRAEALIRVLPIVLQAAPTAPCSPAE